MTHLAHYYVSGLAADDYSIKVPLDWNSPDKGDISIFYRVVTSAQNEGRDLPLLVYLQGGPGGAGPRPSGGGWLEQACKHFRVVLPDQRGTGRSERIDSNYAVRFDSPADLAANLKLFLADSIIRDFEYIRKTQFSSRKWTTLGQSYGGFLTLAYLSLFPEALAASFVTGGIMHVPGNAAEVYSHTVPRMIKKSEEFYGRYPVDIARAAAVADILEEKNIERGDGNILSVRRFQMAGNRFGMKPGFEQLHWLLDEAFALGDGSVFEKTDPLKLSLSDGFVDNIISRTGSASNPLYWTLQEFIYCNEECEPANWAAAREISKYDKLSEKARPIMFFGEAALPEMFEQDPALRPFHAAVDILMQESRWGKIYDAASLASNEVPLQAAVYFDDLYVDSALQLDTLSRTGNSYAWVTNEYEHDGVHNGRVFEHLYEEMLNRGDLREALSS